MFVKVLKLEQLLKNSGLIMAICEFDGYDRNLRFSIEARYSKKLSYVPSFPPHTYSWEHEQVVS